MGSGVGPVRPRALGRRAPQGLDMGQRPGHVPNVPDVPMRVWQRVGARRLKRPRGHAIGSKRGLVARLRLAAAASKPAHAVQRRRMSVPLISVIAVMPNLAKSIGSRSMALARMIAIGIADGTEIP
jgi:hypothetical protein